jgi:O-antigen/teichoic acid export membrane protein
MRSRKAVINTIAGLAYELTAVLCGFILPRLILTAFGSGYNGITSSITQFLGYVALMQAGISGVTKAALYHPLATKNKLEISAIMNATNRYLRIVAVIFIFGVFAFASIFPLFVQDQFEWLFTFTLVLILGISTFAQYYFGLSYQMLLQADQRQSVIYTIRIVTTILNTVIASSLIKLGASIHIVKLGSALVFTLNPLLINLYARHKFKIDKYVPPNNDAIKDKWDSFGLQVANFVNSNTDMVVLTVFRNVYEVSVYTVYYMITSGIRKLLLTFINSLGAAFGNMFAKKEMATLKRNLLLYEQITFAFANFLFSVTLMVVLSFVHVYTSGITDVNYIRPSFAYVLIAASLFAAYRIPYQSIVEVIGHFKQTRNGAFFEAFMNIVVSIILVNLLGLVGVAIGTLCATVFRTFQYALYVSHNVIKRPMWLLVKRLLLSALTFGLIIAACSLLHFSQPANYMQLVLQAIPIALIAALATIGVELVFYRADLQLFIQKLKGALHHKKKQPQQ